MNFLKKSGWVLAAVLIVAGCSGEKAPLASGPITGEAGQYTFLAFAPEGRARAAKLALSPADAVEAGRTVSAIFSPGEKGVIQIDEEMGPSSRDDIDIAFSVSRGAIEKPVLITMTLYGETLSNMVVAFQPAGLKFLEMADLRLAVGDELVDLPLEDLHAWHIYSDGTTEEVRFSIVDQGNGILFKIDVPGFSRYSIGGGT
jgi:hypothetical protein